MRFRLLPRSPVEDSRWARRFALLGFVVAAVAIGWYGQTVVVPLAAVATAYAGHRFSYAWRHRKRPRALQALIAGMMFLGLAYFVFDSVTGLFGASLPQASLVMILVAVTSFDLTTRRNLYSSLWMSLALVYLAAVFAWDYQFGVFVVLWVACLAGFWSAALLQKIGAPRLELPWRPVGTALTAVLLLGVAGFALLPQPSISPSAPLVLSLPANVQFSGLEQPAVPLVQFATDPSGKSSNVDLRFRGRLGSAVVMYIRTGAPAYWRGLTFDRYQSGSWIVSAGASGHFRTFRSYVDSRNLGNTATGPQLGDFVETVRIVRSMPGVIYAAAPVESLYYPAAQVREDGFGDFYAPAPHRAGTTYSVVSHLPDYTPASLRVPNQDNTSSPADGSYLDPGNLSPRAAALARTYLDGYDPLMKRYDAVIALAKHLQADYRYTLATPPAPAGVDPVDDFLFGARYGYCEMFATAAALMLRSQGIPTRLVTGYDPGQYDTTLDQTIVRESDAHAWIEVFFPGHGWVPVDPTPTFPVLAATRFPDRWAASGLAHLIPHLALGAPTAALTGLGALAMLPGLAALAVLLVVGLLWLRARRPPRRRAWSPGEAELIGLYDRLQRRLGLRRAPPETPNEYRQRVAGGELEELLSEVTAAVNRGVYADRWPGPAEVERMRARLS
ncbi:MAG: transglutaminaseTgpA domain-containing protein [Candidatus Dormibacteraeota bacterium]|nr:transglutaminaseTgpA domain-containing protein [Candidatus Dormibacteraeota bacterium]